MKIAIVGYGKMGKEIEAIAKERNHQIVSTIDPLAKEATYKDITTEHLRGADVVLDFTTPEAAIANIKKYCDAGVNVVFGTTGWYGKLAEVEKMVENTEIGFIWSGNFSIGVNLFFKIVRDSCKTVSKVKEYDVFGYELHHNQKKDSPSGTAEMIGKIVLDNFKSKKKMATERLDRKISADEFHMASVRGGSIPGTHVIGFDSAFDTIELKHTVRSRQGLALGAVMAAEWVIDKKGFFNIDDFMSSLLE